MKAIILAAGKPKIFDGPICNVDISGQRLLDIQVSCLRNSGVEDIVLVSGYQAGKIERADIEIRNNPDWASSGSLHSLAAVADAFSGATDVLIVYGDTIFEPGLVKAALRAPSAISPVCYLDRSGGDKGKFREYAIVEDGLIRKVTDAPNTHGVRTVFTGVVRVHAAKASVIRGYLDEGRYQRDGHLGSLIGDMCNKGVDLFPVLIEQGWAEIASNEHYQRTLADTVFIDRIVQVHTDWKKRAEGYNKLDWVNNDVLLSRIADISMSLKPRRVLDVGTGTGKVLQTLKQSVGAGEFWGIDYSQSMLDRIVDRASLTLRCTDAETMDGIPNNHFDLVTARMVFHHINNADLVMDNIARVLRAGGNFLVCEGVPPSLRSIKWYTDMFRYKEDRKTLTEVDLIGMLIRAGFVDIQTQTVIMNRCSLNNWLDNSGIPEENVNIIKQMHRDAPDYIKEDYGMQFIDGDCLMTWRFAVTFGRLRDTSVSDKGRERHERA